MQAHRTLIDALPNGVILVDSAGTVEHCNDNAITLLDADPRGHLWRDCVAKYFTPQADDWHEVSLHNGRRVKVDISAIPEPSGQLVVLTDLTETRRLQHKISHLQRLSSMGRMVASLAHQIRTPLSAALLYAHNLATPNLDQARKQRFSDKLLSRLKSLEQQVNDMLLFAKSGEQQVLEPLDAATLIDSVIQSVTPYADAKKINLKVNTDSVDTRLRGNLTALSGAIQNLLTNAIDASAQGQVVEISAAHSEQQWCCTVSDNGQGIPEHIQQQLFTPFVTGKANGTGLGLAVVKTVVKAHQGELSWHSEADKGTEFCIRLPAEVVQSNPQEICYG